MYLIKSLRQGMAKREFLLDGFKLIDLINPYYIDRKTIYEYLKEKGKIFGEGRRYSVLDFGCGVKPYESLFQCDKYIGCDVKASGHLSQNKNVDVYYEGDVLPFSDESFDLILSTQVFEHIQNLDIIISELYRILKHGGKIILTVPLCGEEHEKPYDFRRFTSFGVRNLLESHSFNVVEIRKSTNYSNTIRFLKNIQIDNIYRNNKCMAYKIKRYVSSIITNLSYLILGNEQCDSDLSINIFAMGEKI